MSDPLDLRQLKGFHRIDRKFYEKKAARFFWRIQAKESVSCHKVVVNTVTLLLASHCWKVVKVIKVDFEILGEY